MAKIYDSSIAYNLVRRYVIFMFKRFFGEYSIIGNENIPADYPLIFAPSHTNALMDALAVHSVCPRSLPVIFLARADIFKNKTAAKFLHFFKIMPAFRMRDGIENLGRNHDVFQQCVDVLDHKKALGIMPEGNQEIERNIRPIVKGIFRIAFAAQKKYGNQPGVKIIPIGINYEDIVKANKPIIINIGKPIEVSEYMNTYEENQVLATNEIRDRLHDDLSNLTVDLATKEHYDCFETALEVATGYELRENNLPDKARNRFIVHQKTAQKLVSLEKNDPESIGKLDALCLEYKNLLKLLKLRDKLFEKNNPGFIELLLESIGLLLALPFFIIGFVLNFFPFFTPVFVRKYIFKAQFIGFFSSLQFGLGILIFPLFYAVQTLIFGIFVTGLWWVVLLFFFAQYPLGKISLSLYKKMRKLAAKIRYRRLIRKKKEERVEIKHLRSRIIEIISHA
jgi:1-acyl-sn-glycerol-3-phosphate acyltransferase